MKRLVMSFVVCALGACVHLPPDVVHELECIPETPAECSLASP
jgi:hypothetical protein